MHRTTFATLQKALIFTSAILVAFCLTQCSDSPTELEMQPIEPDVTVFEKTIAADCREGTLPSNAQYRICVPVPWNGDLVVYAHGYVAPNEPLAIPDDEVEGTPISQIVNELGYAFATTSYRANGLIVSEAVEDLVQLTGAFKDDHPQPRHTFLVGASEGGLVTTLAVEQHPDDFSGGLATCGPIGNFRKQLNHFGDFRVVFDYFFPGVIDQPFVVPPEAFSMWDGTYVPLVKNAIISNPRATKQLLRVTRVPVDPSDPNSAQETILDLLWYNFFGSKNAFDKLGGQPFDNSRRIYFGSYNDFRLNRRIQRIRADQAAINEIEANYQTSGRLPSPLVTLHTTGDPIVPYWHEPLYRWKVFKSGSSLLHSNLPVFRYGHCNFTVSQVLAGFAILVLKVKAKELIVAEHLLPNAESRKEFLRLAEEHGARPRIAAAKHQ